MKNEDRRKQTIRQLLDATKQLLQQKSCGAITMKDLMERSELSKGAIFHYVKSKDELFAWVLEERLDEINAQFYAEVERKADKSFDGPMRTITNHLTELDNRHEVSNKVLVYLLGKEDDPAVAEALHRFYERAVAFSKQWIQVGMQHGVIKPSVDPDKTAEMFVLLTIGMRVRTSFPTSSASLGAGDLASFMAAMLKQD
ncbi:MAG: TetR family transcriptional regulator [Paenibacillus sp.]|jgi:AcrR family transcriptional regulator|nr:TetR family transcriptional regulator [Paenibacillus sp.]